LPLWHILLLLLLLLPRARASLCRVLSHTGRTYLSHPCPSCPLPAPRRVRLFVRTLFSLIPSHPFVCLCLPSSFSFPTPLMAWPIIRAVLLQTHHPVSRRFVVYSQNMHVKDSKRFACRLHCKIASEGRCPAACTAGYCVQQHTRRESFRGEQAPPRRL